MVGARAGARGGCRGSIACFAALRSPILLFASRPIRLNCRRAGRTRRDCRLKTARRTPNQRHCANAGRQSSIPMCWSKRAPTSPWGPVRPEQVEMRYWFTAAPGQPVVFRYDAAQHEANQRRLVRLLADILGGESVADFPKVADTPPIAAASALSASIVAAATVAPPPAISTR